MTKCKCVVKLLNINITDIFNFIINITEIKYYLISLFFIILIKKLNVLWQLTNIREP